ncbi:MAG: energy transducer TonB [Deltaproteobacteria bacterium]|jgi:protein TonB|nr:energy transducer TonB [Deltaproteobacteria bacterium]
MLMAVDQFDQLSMAFLKKGFALSLVFHCLIVGFLMFAPGEKPREFIPIAVMEFGDYDPLGGQGGGGEVGEPEPEIPPPPPEPEPVPEPEVPEEEVKVVETVAPEAEEAPPPPPPPVDKPKPKAKPKPKPKANPAPASGATGEGTATAPGPGGPGPGGTPGGTGRGTSNAAAAYRNQIRARLERNKKYPPASQSRRETGVVQVSFIVLKNGAVTSPRLEQSSGHKRLDDEAMALLSRVSPLPPIPPEVGLDTMPLKVPLRFSLR